MKKQIIVIRSSDRTSGIPESFKIELNQPITDVVKVSLLSANIPTTSSDYYFIRIDELHNKVSCQNGFINYSSFVIPHHHSGIPASNTEYMLNKGFTQEVIQPDKSHLYFLNIRVLGNNGQLISGLGEWSFVLEITVER